MSSIEDLLNASDSSGEDLDTDGIDLENLLNDDSDDSEEDAMVTTGVKSNRLTVDDILSHADGPLHKGPSEPIAELLASMPPVAPATSSASLSALAQSSDSDDEDDVFSTAAGTGTGPGPADTTFPDHVGLLSGLDMARRREHRNVMSGNRDVVSALHAKLVSEGSIAALSHIKTSELAVLSSQLRRNTTHRHIGPGVAVVLHVHLKFIAIGTSRGLILLFDHFQEIRQVIGSNANTAPQTVKTNAGVTAIDSTAAADMMVAGYDNGEVLLWDVPKGIILKRVTEIHRVRILRLQLINPVGDGSGAAVGTTVAAGVVGNLLNSSQSSAASSTLSVITVDTEGVVFRTKFSKMIWTSYTIDTECLLDGKAGCILDAAVLPPLPSLQRYSTASQAIIALRIHSKGAKGKNAEIVPRISAFPLFADVEWTALSSPSKTFIAQVQPNLKILHRWPAPASDIAGTAVVALDWLWHPVDTCNAALARRAQIEQLISQMDSPHGADQGVTGDDSDSIDNEIVVYPILARTWGPYIQLITCYAKTSVMSGGDASAALGSTHGPVEVVGFCEIASRTLDFNIMAAKWLAQDSMKLVILTATHMLVIDASRPDLEIIEMMALSPNITAAIADSIPKNRLGEGLLSTSCCSNETFFVLTESELYNFTLQSWVEQVDAMIRDGKWLDALAKALQETRLKHGGVGGNVTSIEPPSHHLYLMDPEDEYLDTKTQKENDVIDGFLKRYLSVAINKQHAAGFTTASTSLGISGAGNAMRNQYHLVAGVCIEYCVNANRLRYLFSEVFSVFVNAKQDAHFLDALEPFILNRRVRWLPPKIIGSLFEMSARSHRLPALERLIVHLDLSYNVDIHFIIKFLHEHNMSSAYLYSYASGLGDCAGAFHSLFSAWLLCSDSNGSSEETAKAAVADQRNSDQVATACGYPSSEQAEVGYRLFLFLECVGKGTVFPRCDKIEPPPSVDILWRLLELLLCEKYVPHYSVSFGEKKTKTPLFSLENEMYPYMFALFRVDPNALFYIISECVKIISTDSVPRARQRSGSETATADLPSDAIPSHLECSVAYALHHSFQFVRGLCEEYLVQYEVAQRPFFEQCINSIISCKEVLPVDLLRSTVQYIGTHVKPRLLAEEMAAQLAQAQTKLNQPLTVQKVPGTDGGNKTVYPPLRAVLEEHRFYRSSLYISFWKHRNGNGSRVFATGLRYYLTMALRAGNREAPSGKSLSKMKASEAEVGLLAAAGPVIAIQKGDFGSQAGQPFLYIEDQFRALYSEEEESSIISTYATVVIGALSELYELDKEKTRSIATTHLLSFVSELCVNLKKYPTLLFDVLFAMFVVASSSENETTIGDTGGPASSGRRTSMIAVNTNDFNRRGSMINASNSVAPTTAGSVASTNNCATYFSHANMLVFLKLVATLQPRSLYGVLCSTENYSLDEAIVLCRERRVFDASSFLLERVGDITGALDVSLNEFTSCCSKLSSDISVLITRKSPGGSVLSNNAELLYFKRAMNAALKSIESSESNDASTSIGVKSGTLISGASAFARDRPQSTLISSSNSSHSAALELLEMLVRLPSFSDAIYALNFSMRLCSTHSNKTNHSMWFKVLDHALAERAKYQSDISVQKPGVMLTEDFITDEVCSSFIGQLMQHLMSRMLAMGGVNPQDIVRRITQEQAMRGSRFSEFKEVFIGMVESHSFELFMYETVVQLHSQDLSALQKKRVTSKRCAVRVDPQRQHNADTDDDSEPIFAETTQSSEPK